MTGANGFGKFGSTDGNDIPIREAFEWYQLVEGQGMALWYKNTGPWWDQTQLKNNDGISVEEQKADPNSLWNFYKTLIALRKANSAIQTGNFQFVDSKNDQVLSFLRWDDTQSILVLINLNEKEETVSFDISKFPVAPNASGILELLKPAGGKSLEISEQKISAKLANFDVQLWQIR
jgi:glycosidase